MAFLKESVGYIPITLITDLLAHFLTGYRSDDAWGNDGTPPSGATRFTAYALPSKHSDYERELEISEYLDNVDDITELRPWDSTSTVTLQLQYWSGSNWVYANAPINFDAADWKSGTTASDFTVESKSDDKNVVRLQFPEKVSTADLTNYRLKIDIDQEPEPTPK